MTDNQNEMLDLILTVLRDRRYGSDAVNVVSESDIKRVADDYLLREDVVYALYDVLIQDGFVIKKLPTNEYEITPRGILFNENGGYRTKTEKENELARQVKATQSNVEALEKTTFFLTLVIAVGAGLTAIYSVIQMWEFYMCYRYDLFCG